MRNTLAALPLLLVLVPGCVSSRLRLSADASGIEPLSEAEFDQFATQLADDITQMLNRHGYWPPAVIATPCVEPNGVEGDSVAHAFAGRLADGLNDRLQRSAFFSPPGVRPPDLRCTLRFASEPADGSHRTIVFRLFDEKSGQERLAATHAYQSPRLAVSGPATQPPETELRIDAAPGEIGRHALRLAAWYEASTIVGDAGRVIFLDVETWHCFWLRSQRATRTADDGLRVELAIRARGREHDAQLRVIFYDDEGNAVDVTPVIPYCFVPHYTKQVTISSTDSRATHYTCLIGRTQPQRPELSQR